MWSWFLVSYRRVKLSHKKREQCKCAQYKHKSGYRTGPNEIELCYDSVGLERACDVFTIYILFLYGFQQICAIIITSRQNDICLF
jgi:hypothetical protein